VESAGIWIKGGSQNLIEENEIWDHVHFRVALDLAKGSSAENNGIVLTNEIARETHRRNAIHGTFNESGPAAHPPPAASQRDRPYDNILYEHTDDGMEPKANCSNVRI